jgi:uncharacterized phiE125 gp8 family phage protein
LHDDEDEWIDNLIDTSISFAENFMRIKLRPYEVSAILDYTRSSRLYLPVGPATSITKVMICRYDNNDYELKKDDYSFTSTCLQLCNLSAWDKIKIEYMAGFDDASIIPASLKQGLLLHIAEMYDSRGAISYVSGDVEKLYQPYKTILI